MPNKRRNLYLIVGPDQWASERRNSVAAEPQYAPEANFGYVVCMSRVDTTRGKYEKHLVQVYRKFKSPAAIAIYHING